MSENRQQQLYAILHKYDIEPLFADDLAQGIIDFLKKDIEHGDDQRLTALVAACLNGRFIESDTGGWSERTITPEKLGDVIDWLETGNWPQTEKLPSIVPPELIAILKARKGLLELTPDQAPVKKTLPKNLPPAKKMDPKAPWDLRRHKTQLAISIYETILPKVRNPRPIVGGRMDTAARARGATCEIMALMDLPVTDDALRRAIIRQT